MSRLVDHEAVVLDLRTRLLERGSWGRDQVLGLITELEAAHRVDETREAAFLRRFSDHFHDTFFGLIPRPSATTDPLTDPDPTRTAAAMDAGAAFDQPPTGSDACPPPRSRISRTSSRPLASSPASV